MKSHFKESEVNHILIRVCVVYQNHHKKLQDQLINCSVIVDPQTGQSNDQTHCQCSMKPACFLFLLKEMFK